MNAENKQPDNKAADDDENVFGMRKITFWEKYGVKRYPYHGRRRFTPILKQHFDGGISITNDVFGLTIYQFEQRFKACLERRKLNSQFILNLRYPFKCSKEYLYFLEYCTDHNEGELILFF